MMNGSNGPKMIVLLRTVNGRNTTEANANSANLLPKNVLSAGDRLHRTDPFEEYIRFCRRRSTWSISSTSLFAPCYRMILVRHAVHENAVNLDTALCQPEQLARLIWRTKFEQSFPGYLS
jgi:hypothetical protein